MNHCSRILWNLMQIKTWGQRRQTGTGGLNPGYRPYIVFDYRIY
jgi:hypothetical protein